MKFKTLSITLIAAIALPSLMVAQSGPKKGDAAGKGQGQGPSFERVLQHLDSDGDGKISESEAAAAPRGKLAENFDRIDANGDGFLTRDEMLEQRKQLKAKNAEKRDRWQSLDADGSGGLSYEEVELSGNERMLQAFGRIDADGDGEVTPAELRTAKQNRPGPKGPGKS